MLRGLTGAGGVRGRRGRAVKCVRACMHASMAGHVKRGGVCLVYLLFVPTTVYLVDPHPHAPPSCRMGRSNGFYVPKGLRNRGSRIYVHEAVQLESVKDCVSSAPTPPSLLPNSTIRHS